MRTKVDAHGRIMRRDSPESFTKSGPVLRFRVVVRSIIITP